MAAPVMAWPGAGVFDRIEPFRRGVAVLQRFELRHAPESGARPDIRWLAGGDIVGTSSRRAAARTFDAGIRQVWSKASASRRAACQELGPTEPALRLPPLVSRSVRRRTPAPARSRPPCSSAGPVLLGSPITGTPAAAPAVVGLPPLQSTHHGGARYAAYAASPVRDEGVGRTFFRWFGQRWPRSP